MRRRSPVPDMSTSLANFWRGYVHIGVLTYGMGAMVVMVYALTTPGPHRRAMLLLGASASSPRSAPSNGWGCGS